LKSHTPTKDEREWMDQITELGCCICLKEYEVFTPAEVHHISGKTKLGSHFHTIPLCYRHHREGSNTELYVSRHPNKASFVRRHGSEEELFLYTQEQIHERHGQ